MDHYASQAIRAATALECRWNGECCRLFGKVALPTACGARDNKCTADFFNASPGRLVDVVTAASLHPALRERVMALAVPL